LFFCGVGETHAKFRWLMGSRLLLVLDGEGSADFIDVVNLPFGTFFINWSLRLARG